MVGTTHAGSGEVVVVEGSGGDGGRPSGQAAVGLSVVVAGRGCGGSPVQGGDVGAVVCDAAGALCDTRSHSTSELIELEVWLMPKM